MARYQSPSRSDEEWFQIINECRRSGLSDSQWCKQHDIRESTFFCAVGRLRKKAYAIPVRNQSIDVLSNSLPKQDVVRIDIEPEILSSGRPEPMQVLPERLMNACPRLSTVDAVSITDALAAVVEYINI